jgi:hypothetical protein
LLKLFLNISQCNDENYKTNKTLKI